MSQQSIKNMKPKRDADNMPIYHRYADIFPMMDPRSSDFLDMAKDIRDKGLQQPITLLDGEVLDGRNRLMACDMTQTEPRFVEYQGDDPLQFVISANLHRRQLNASQRAMVGTRMLPFFKEQAQKRYKENVGRPSKDTQNDWVDDDKSNQNFDSISNARMATEDAAKAVNVSHQSISSAKKVDDQGVSELKQAVINGDIAVSEAAQIVEATKPEAIADIKAKDYDQVVTPEQKQVHQQKQAEIIQMPKAQRKEVVKKSREQKAREEREKIFSGLGYDERHDKYSAIFTHVNILAKKYLDGDIEQQIQECIESFPHQIKTMREDKLQNFQAMIDFLTKINEGISRKQREVA